MNDQGETEKTASTLSNLLASISEAMIRQHASDQSFNRGEHYVSEGAVSSLMVRGQTLHAEVWGSQYEPYEVRVDFDAGGITSAWCSCPYDWGGWCKHIVATLLTVMEESEQLETRPTPDKLLADLGEDDLRGLLLDLVKQYPNLIDIIEGQVADIQRKPESQASSPRRRPAIDQQAVQRQVSAALHALDRMRPSEAYWHVADVVGSVEDILAQAEALIEGSDGANALLMLEAITEAYTADWVYLDDSNGYAGDFFGHLGVAWTEAALVAELEPEERTGWAEKLAAWQYDLSDYGVDDAFDAAQAAFLHGWDYVPLQRAMDGEITETGAWDGPAPWFADDLAQARLRVLARQERYDAYLNLAQAEGQLDAYVLMLARLGRVDEAVEEGLNLLDGPSAVLAVAKVLREQGALDGALRLAEAGLHLGDQETYGALPALAAWTSELAAGMERWDLALDAAVVAFRAHPTLEAFRRVQELAGDTWPDLRASLLASLRPQEPGYYVSEGKIDIYLHEGLLDDAINALDRGAAHSYGMLERVMDAVIEHNPTWVIQKAQEQAMRIISPGQSQHYHHAVAWLRRARDAYRAAGREDDWRAYLAGIRDEHGRKYKLMGLLKDL